MRDIEIGSYHELELRKGNEYHNDAVRLNLGRSALKYILLSLKAKRIAVPYFTCQCVPAACAAAGCEVTYYDIDDNFFPVGEFEEGEFLLYTNYYGVCGANVRRLSAKYGERLIIDNTMAFYMPSLGLNSFYSARKFFGVSDGAYCYCTSGMKVDFPVDVSWSRMEPLLRRIDSGADDGYPLIVRNEEENDVSDIKQMSRLTRAILSSIDYDEAKKRRLENFDYLHQRLCRYNRFKLSLTADDVPMKYPFVFDSESLKGELNKTGIFTARYWDDLQSEAARKLAYKIFPLSMDQRYGKREMQTVVDCVLRMIGG